MFMKKSPGVVENDVRAKLARLLLPDGRNIVAAGLVADIQLRQESDGTLVNVVLEVDPRMASALADLGAKAECAIKELRGVSAAHVVLTAHRGAAQAQERPAPQARAKIELPNVRHIIAVASGKGGVGKSTTAVNLAVAMAMNGLRVGLLDADIYGPSIPRMLNLSGKTEQDEQKKMIPKERYGLATMSMGFLVEEDAPVVWRGPMVHGAIQQLFRDVAWGARDVIVVDMPPGTGDAQLTLAQSVSLSGAIIVSTPQDIALIDARKGLNMFRRVDVPVLGIVENMSVFQCPNCGHESHIFSHGGARHEAEKLGVPFLAEVPLTIDVRETSDMGEPIVFSKPDSSVAKVYRAMAAGIWEKLP